VRNYVEPFAGSLAVLLKRPSEPKIETVNDKDCYLANFWRALARDPEAVAYYADWPVNETDMHARHRWLVKRAKFRRRMLHDPDFYDPRIAGWWVWGQCLWIGSGWCAQPDWTGRVNAGRYARGIHGAGVVTRNGDTSEQARRPQLTYDQGIIIKPKLTNNHGGGVGVHRQWKKRPAERRGQSRGVHAVEVRRWQGGGAGGGSGVHAPSLGADTWQQPPDLSGSRGASGRGIHGVGPRTAGLYTYLGELGERLRRVRVCCGDWQRVLTPSITTYIGTTGVLLDPPYDQSQRAICYSEDHNVSAAVRAWAIEHGEDPKFRIALCGYEGEHDMPADWHIEEWKAHGGYSRSARGVANRERERIWFSPHCLVPGRRGQQLLTLEDARVVGE
jgi:hypothetical protein